MTNDPSASFPTSHPIPIEDADDPRIAVFRDIRERDLTRRNGFIAEGTVVLDQLLKSRHIRPTALFILENRLAGLAPILARLPEGVPVYVAGRPVMDRVAGFAMNRGVLAFGERIAPEDADPDADLRRLLAEADPKAPLVVAIGLSNHDNVGAIFRNAAAFGAAGVVLDETSCHPLYRKALRVSVGTVLTLPFVRGGDGSAILDRLGEASYTPIALSPRGETSLAEFQPSEKLALVLGTEGRGLPQSLMQRARTLRIPIAPGVDSLNVATAAAIVLAKLYSAA
ncbi:TrmH family RNA methyltransferase [Jiella marina]|uniref:TrmH family RNA methyltransferase n=1 Tax=Jiella sp. LLJ827 TaxID=2917712 RepID=UPI002100B9C7|nr:RNA methyltransferase [Jiella sp. LLJ827]MCQ0987192.1 RNA methyltransferase [Jiella sp. LLJ827]